MLCPKSTAPLHQDVMLSIDVPFPPAVGDYRLTIKSGGVTDAECNPLGDDDGDGVGTDFIHPFTVSALSLAGDSVDAPYAPQLTREALTTQFIASIERWVQAGISEQMSLSLADDRMDLLTTLMREIGHLLGVDHIGEELLIDNLMQSTLERGTRRVPTQELVEQLFDETADWVPHS